MQYETLLDELAGALDRGEVPPAEVERLLRRGRGAGRADLAGGLRALGVLVCFAGAAALLASLYGDLPPAMRLVAPFAFPAAAIAATLLLHRDGRPAWEVELAGLVAYVALGLAYLATGAEADAGAGYGTFASLAAGAVVLGLERAIRSVRLTSWGLAASLVGFATCLADLGSIAGASDPRIYAAQGAVAALAGGVLVHRRCPAAGLASLRTASLLLVGASALGIVDAGWDATPWHLVLTIALVGTLLAAALLDAPALVWTGALAGLVWLAALGVLAGLAVWPLAAIVLGAGLVTLGALVGRLRRPPRLAPPPAGAH